MGFHDLIIITQAKGMIQKAMSSSKPRMISVFTQVRSRVGQHDVDVVGSPPRSANLPFLLTSYFN